MKLREDYKELDQSHVNIMIESLQDSLKYNDTKRTFGKLLKSLDEVDLVDAILELVEDDGDVEWTGLIGH